MDVKSLGKMTPRLSIDLLLNSILSIIFLMSLSDIQALKHLAPVLYGSFGIATILAVVSRNKASYWHYLLPLIVWDVALQSSMPVFTRAFTPLLMLVVAVLLMFGRNRQALRFPIFSVIMILSVCVCLVHFLLVQIRDQEMAVYLLLLSAAGFLAFALFNRASEELFVGFSVALKSIGVSTAFFAMVNVYYALSHSIITTDVFADVNQRLGILGNVSSNTAGYVYGLGALSCFLLLPVIRGGGRRILFACMLISVCALFLTKTLSSLLPFVTTVVLCMLSNSVGALGHSSQRSNIHTYALRATMVSTVIGLGLFYIISSQADMLEFLNTGRDLSTLTGRTVLWNLALDNIEKSPLIGFSQAEMADVFPRVVYTKGADFRLETVLTPHNIILGQALYVGVPLALGLFWSISSLIISNRKGFRINLHSNNVPVWALPLFMLVSHMALDAWYLISYIPVILALVSLRAGGAYLRTHAGLRPGTARVRPGIA